MRNNESYKIIFTVAAIIAVVALAYAMKAVLATVTISVVFYYILDPVACFFTGRSVGKRVKITRLWASVLALIAGVVAFTVFLLILIPPLMDQIQRLIGNMPEYTSKTEETVRFLQHKYNMLKLPPDVEKGVNAGLEGLIASVSDLVKHAARGASEFLSQLILLFMIPFLTFYMLVEKYDVKAAIVRIFPERWQEEASQILSQSSHALKGYITGQLILSLFMGALVTVCLTVMGVRPPLLLGLVAGVTKLIPVVGIIMGCVPAAFVALSTSLSLALWVILLFTIIQLLENKIILPVLLSKYVDLSPLAILCSLIVGEQLGGLLGMFIATPIVAMLKVLYTHLRERYD